MHKIYTQIRTDTHRCTQIQTDADRPVMTTKTETKRGEP